MLESLFKKIASLSNISVNIANILRTSILKNIFKRLLLTVRKYAVSDTLQLLYEQPSTGIHNASTKIGNSCQIPEKSIRYRIILNWTPEGKGPTNSVLSVSPFVSSILFSESALRIF